MECSICYDLIDPENEYITGCNHIFHEKCIGRWFQYSHKCPMCRTSKFNISIQEYDHNYWKNNKKMTDLIQQSDKMIFKIN